MHLRVYDNGRSICLQSEKEVVLTESFSYSRLQEGGGREGGRGGGLGGKGEAGREERGGYDTSAGMEGDKKYNTEQAGGEL